MNAPLSISPFQNNHHPQRANPKPPVQSRPRNLPPLISQIRASSSAAISSMLRKAVLPDKG